MKKLTDILTDIEKEIHTLETATPRNSATVSRGGLRVVDDGKVIVVDGGTVYFDEGGSAVSSNYSIEDKSGWQIGTERRGSSIVVFNDAPGAGLTVSTANSSSGYEEIHLTAGETSTVSVEGYSAVVLHVFHTSLISGSITLAGHTVSPRKIIKSQKDQWAFSYMTMYTDDVEVMTDMDNVVLRVAYLSVNNAS